ncbi:MAG: DUF4845 domain-containing protein [Gammaproteobacteria bacterium]|nr:DUF4845 domain-containing protein [Gammaproteobacteria bacterium]
MNHNMNKQRGMTGMGWLTILMLIGFFAMLIFKLTPIYLENYSVKSTLQSFEEEPFITKKSTREIRKMLMARLWTNGIRDIKKEHVTIENKKGVLKIAINYFVRRPMMGNVEIIVTFDNKVELVSN